MKILFTIIIFLIFLVSCSIDENSVAPFGLEIVASYRLDVAEPSGLTLGANNNELWTVSDQTNLIYKLDTKGNVLDTLSYIGDDLEGIAFDKTTQTLWVVEEATDRIVNIDLSGEEIGSHQIDIDNQANHGLEGITLIPSSHTIYAINEKEPSILLELKSDFTVEKTYQLNFADDYSGLYYDDSLKKIWILSDENRTLYLWGIQKGVEESYPLSFFKPEGIAIDTEHNIFYIVSDSESKLYVLDEIIPDAPP